MIHRLSNFELLRIIAMFMIIAVHADYWILGIPSIEEFEVAPIGTITRIFIEQLTVVGVNIFVLISGWFGIRPSTKSFLSLCFQVIFYLLGVYVIGIVFGFTQFSIKQLAQCFLFTHSYWFVKAYIALLIMAPILNKFIESVNKKTFATTLVLLYGFQFVYGWINSEVWIAQGYSAFSFIALYLLARYVRLYNKNWMMSPKLGLAIYIYSSILATLLGILGTCYDLPIITTLMVSYVSPLVVAGSIGLLLQFSNLAISYSPKINFIARSTFAVYLFPCFYISDYIYKYLFISIYNDYYGITVIGLIFVILIALYLISIAIDQIRIWSWNLIWSSLENRINKSLRKINI